MNPPMRGVATFFIVVALAQLAGDSRSWVRADAQPREEDASLNDGWLEGFIRRPMNGEPFGAEDPHAEDDVPSIPEPMVFDLVRSLGARRGEFEINVLGLVPFRRYVPSASEIPDQFGLLPTNRLPTIEWAPEVEYAVWDGFAVEFELPMEDGRVAAYKAAAQYTIGTAFDRQFIHGLQVILQYDIEPSVWLPTFLYIAGFQFSETWSALGMIGFSNEIKAEDPAERVLTLVNFTLFADLTDYVTIGLETNYAANMSGAASLFVIPQVHYEVTNNFMVQAGVGVRFSEVYTLPEAAFRVIRTF
jgi:hypothetical protein